MPTLVEIAKVDRFNPKTLVVSYTDGTILSAEAVCCGFRSLKLLD